MMEKNKTELFEKSSIPKAVAALCVPTIISSLVTVVYNLADTFFVGMLNDPIENAAVTIAAPLMLAFNAVNNLFGIGSSSMMSRALGKKDFDSVRKSSAFGFYCSLFCGVMFSLLYIVLRVPLLELLGAKSETAATTAGYLRWTVACGAAPAILNVVMAYLVRAQGSALHASIGTMSGCLLNIILDPFFILPQFLGMGAAGAGLATFISNCVACAYFIVLVIVKRKSTFVSINPKHFTFKKEIVKGVFAVGIPAGIQNLLNVTSMTVLNNFMSSYGSDAVASIGIAQKTSMIPMYIALGFSQGIMPLVGYNYAAKNYKRMKSSIAFSAKIIISFMVLTTALYCIFAPNIIRMFMDNDIIVSYGAAFMRGLSLAQPLLCIDFLAVGVFQACGMGGKSLVFAFLRKIVFEIPALIILDKIFPMYGLGYAQLVSEAMLSIIATVVLIKMLAILNKKTQTTLADVSDI